MQEIYNMVVALLKENVMADDIPDRKEFETFELQTFIDNTDQDIKDYIDRVESDEERRELLFGILQKIKINAQIKMQDEFYNDDLNESYKKKIKVLFGKVVEPNDIVINGEEVCLKYNFEPGSNLKNKIIEYENWTEENVCKTMANELGISIDNIRLIKNLDDYINFVDTLDDNNYVSRGQKDCAYNLKPSLHRLYDEGLGRHAAQYEALFKQRILYYDEKMAGKNDDELRAYGQHFGLPTNYLDFTEAHLISLLFAVEEYEYLDNHSIVYFVNAFAYNTENIQLHEKFVDFSDEEEKHRIQRNYNDKSYFFRVGNCNERIHFQRGCFLKVEHGDSLSDMLSKYTKIVIVDKTCKENILKALFKLGISFENIYPDKDNMVKTIRFIKERM